MTAIRATYELIGRLDELAAWHDDMNKHPIDVSGSDRVRFQQREFHRRAAEDIRAAILSLDTD